MPASARTHRTSASTCWEIRYSSCSDVQQRGGGKAVEAGLAAGQPQLVEAASATAATSSLTLCTVCSGTSDPTRRKSSRAPAASAAAAPPRRAVAATADAVRGRTRSRARINVAADVPAAIAPRIPAAPSFAIAGRAASAFPVISRRALANSPCTSERTSEATVRSSSAVGASAAADTAEAVDADDDSGEDPEDGTLVSGSRFGLVGMHLFDQFQETSAGPPVEISLALNLALVAV